MRPNRLACRFLVYQGNSILEVENYGVSAARNGLLESFRPVGRDDGRGSLLDRHHAVQLESPQGDGALPPSRRRGKAGRADQAHQAAQASGQKVNICRNGFRALVGMEINKPDKYLKSLERVKGIEPSYSAWKAAALPLSYTRIERSPNTARRPPQPPRRASLCTGPSQYARVFRRFLARTGRIAALTAADSPPILLVPSTKKGGDLVSCLKRCHLAGIAR